MVARDPKRRSALARAAVLARYAGMTEDERREVTAKARAAFHAGLRAEASRRLPDAATPEQVEALAAEINRERMATMSARRWARKVDAE